MLRSAAYYIKNFSFNILPLVNKAPVGDWIKWQQVKMNEADLNSFNWQKVNGVGAVCGINELRCLDFDHVENFEIVKKFIRKLGLPAEYPWTVQSGSGNGFHIWFYCMDDSYLFKMLGGKKSYYKLIPLPLSEPLPLSKPLPFNKVEDPAARNYNNSGGEAGRGLCDHIELRWKNCQTVLPPSLHPSGNKYKFHFVKKIGTKGPANIPVGRLIDTIEELCDIEKPAEKKITRKPDKDRTAVTEDSDLAAISEYLSGKVNNYDDWMRIGFSLASCGEAGRKYFLMISRNNTAYNDTEKELNKKYDGFLKDYNGDITIRSFYRIAEDYGYKKPFEKFWRIIDYKAKISSNQIVEFLQGLGYSKMIVGNDYTFIREKENVISTVSRIAMKDDIVKYIYDNASDSEKAIILDRLITSNNTFCSDNTFEYIKTVVPNFKRGTIGAEYFFFSNGFAEVTGTDIKFNNYSELCGKIWERQKIKRDFKFSIEKSEFQTFIENICKKDEDRINSLRSAIGYLMVTYKDPANTKAIIFTDEKLSENAYGRSGKGLVAKAISQVKNLLIIDGKNFSFDKSFLFQSVSPDTQLIIFDDVKKKFTFDKLFSILTEGMTIERKNKPEYHLPFELAPKILITTNHTISGNDDSSLDRQFVIEFSDYYNAQHKPRDEFGHLFFYDWSNEQWYAFYTYMLDCCRFYLRNGLKTYKYVNLAKKKLIDATAPEFEEFIKEVPLNTEQNKKTLWDEFKLEYEDFSQLKQNTFVNWIKTYATLNDYELAERRSGNDRFFTFIPH